MKHSLKSTIGLTLVFLSFATMTTAQFDVRVNGRVDFLADHNETYNNTVTVTGAPAGSGTQVFANEAALMALYGAGGATYTETKATNKETTTFGTTGRVDINASNQTDSLDYGGFARLDLSPDTQSISDVDGHLYLKGSFGKLTFGTDIDAAQDAFDTDHVSAGPLSVGKDVSFGGSLNMAPHQDSSIVYSSPIISGLRLEGEIDDNSNWNGSLSYRSSVGVTDIEAAVAADKAETYGGYLQASYGDLTAMGFYMGDKDKETAGGAGVAYHLGPVNLSLEGSVSETNEIVGIDVVGVAGTTKANITSHSSYKETDVVVGAAYDIAPGLELSGSVGITDHDRLGKQTRAQGRLRVTF